MRAHEAARQPCRADVGEIIEGDADSLARAAICRACRLIYVARVSKGGGGDKKSGVEHLPHPIVDCGQLANIAVKMLEPLKEEAKKRQLSGKGTDGSGGRGNEKNLPPPVGEGWNSGEAVDQAAKLATCPRCMREVRR